jgi:hypothetical protein
MRSVILTTVQLGPREAIQDGCDASIFPKLQKPGKELPGILTATRTSLSRSDSMRYPGISVADATSMQGTRSRAGNLQANTNLQFFIRSVGNCGVAPPHCLNKGRRDGTTCLNPWDWHGNRSI